MDILSSRLTSYLNRIGENIITNWYEIRDIHNWMLAEIYRKKKAFPVWKKKVLFSPGFPIKKIKKAIRLIAQNFTPKKSTNYSGFFSE